MPCFAQCGIWKDDALTNNANFYVQSYDTLDNAVVVIYSPNAQDFAAFLDSDMDSAEIDADDLGGMGHHLTMSFMDEDNAAATLTLAGSAPVNYSLIRSYVGFGKGENGDQGPEGPQGPVGPAGATGAQGPPGPSEVYENNTIVTIEADSSATCTASCDSGDKVTGGGWSAYTVILVSSAPVDPTPTPGPISTITQYPSVGYSYPTSSMNGWTVKAYNELSKSISLKCTAVCADVTE